MAIKKGHIMLMFLIPSKYKVANINVYLALVLVEELQILRQGVQIEDMSKALLERQFKLRAILIRIIKNLPRFRQCSS
jgi:hypothetical protein